MCVYMCTRICAIHFSHGFMLKYFRVCLWALLCIYVYVSVCMCARRPASLTTSAIRVHNKLNATFHNKIKNAK